MTNQPYNVYSKELLTIQTSYSVKAIHTRGRGGLHNVNELLHDMYYKVFNQKVI